MPPRRTLEQLQDQIGPVPWFVREQRKRLGYTQEEFAKRVGVGLRFLRDLELGKPSVRMDKVNEVLHYLGHQLVPGPIGCDKDSPPHA